MGEIKHVAGYIRVSTAEQSIKGFSIETQMAEIESYVKQHNMKLVDFYIDRGITARKSLEKRVDFMRMMQDVEAKKINHIVVLRLDRFFRNVYDYHKMMNEYLTPQKCGWSAVKEDYTTETTNGRLMINLRLSIAEQECDTDSDRIKDVFANKVQNGFAISGAVGWPWKVENKKVVINEEKRALMNELIDYVEISSSVRGTLNYMKNTHGISFCYESLSRLLKNPLLYGSYRGNDNYCEAFMTKERFDNLRRLLDKNVKVKKNNHYYIFSGLIICEECGYRMSGTHCNDYSYYRCSNHFGNKRCGNALQINEVKLEKYLLENVDHLLKNHIHEIEKLEETIKPIKSNRKAIEKKLQKLNDLYVNDFIDMDKYKQEYALLQSQIIDTPETQKKDPTVLKEFLNSNFREIYKTLSVTEKQAFWRSIIKQVRVHKKEIVGVDFL